METAGKNLSDESMRESMKDSGLGTPATRAAIIEGLLSREMMVRKGKAIVPTEKGVCLVENLKSEALKSPELTGDWEARLERVRRGELSSDEFMESVRDYTIEIISSIKGQSVGNAGGIIVATKPRLPPCPKCKSELQVKEWRGKYYVKCSGAKNPECKISYDCDRTGKSLGGLCKKCKHPLKVTKSGSKICIGCDSWENKSETRRGSSGKVKGQDASK
jgi:DNA topoisomerase-3